MILTRAFNQTAEERRSILKQLESERAERARLTDHFARTTSPAITKAAEPTQSPLSPELQAFASALATLTTAGVEAAVSEMTPTERGYFERAVALLERHA